ncbi:type II CRISPR RNA-guided endonuclease Cas9 [Methylopila turkensis]|uniref:CRISPR-associated endonuclease Cas9 n=1 Tax=Methylopila turkensis TaxID=1437816 RepID=A0A9W6N5Y4_9HYPH|nr:type II CRISPR RNA-guided endonuclease Cas9 [Methylopila turkensis]GLK79659.1 CRISPR-associated endonuclease Cas9 [Methylopila turkensis]
MRWRLALDLGTNSLGWIALSLDQKTKPDGIVAIGSRIFSDGRDPKSGASLAVDRRDARAMRRRRDRFKQRQAALLKHLTRLGLFPEDAEERKALETLDPYALRSAALTEKLPTLHLGRALFHLGQRRGFKSNRKADRGKDEDAGKIAIGVERLRAAMEDDGAETLGDFLHKRRKRAEEKREAGEEPGREGWVRTRLRDAAADGYDFYPSRAIVEEEFETIWERQAPHHPAALTAEAHDCLYEIIFHQRPLKAPKIGRCTLVPTDDRLPKAHPLFQTRRLLEEVNALMVVRVGEDPQPLTLEQRDQLLRKLEAAKTGKVTFRTLRATLKLDPDARFNKESDNRPDLKGDEIIAEFGAAKRFGNVWAHLSPAEQWEVVSRVRELETDAQEADLRAWLQETHKLSPEQAKAVCSARLPQGFGRFGQEATERLIAELEKDVVVYSEAVQRAGFGHHSDFRTGEVFTDESGLPALPYYGVALERHIMPGTSDPNETDEALRIGRLTNPTVHIGLNQLKKVVNALIRAYGPPEEVAIELARELKLDEDEKRKRNRENNDNRIAAEARAKKLAELGQRNSGANRALLKLWEELNPENCLDRRCPYSGQQISAAMLFNGEVDVDHILPFTQTLDDSNANKTVCLREANRLKRNRSPYDARAGFAAKWGAAAEWDAIAARAANMQKNKRWRFEPNAMERFNSDDPEFGKGFIARQLTDTQHLARLAREYLSALYPHKGDGSSHVWVSPGRLTEMVRRKLGLNDLLPDHNFGGGADQPKNRLDHRHHAIDAAVIGVVDRGLLQEIARASGEEGKDGRERIVIPEPWDGFRDDLRRAVNAIVVSHRPDHGTVSKASLPKGRDATAGRLHNDTAYGLTGEKDARGSELVVHRAPLSSFKKAADLEAIRDDGLRQALKDWTAGKEARAFEDAIRTFGDPEKGPRSYPNIRRVRVMKALSVIPIRDRNGRIYKGYKGDSNYRYDVWELSDGSWKAEVISMFDAHKAGWSSTLRTENPTAKKVLSLRQDDLLAVETESGLVLMRVVKFNQMGRLFLADHNEAGALKARDADKSDPFKYLDTGATALRKLRARQVRVDALGRVSDPGFPARTAVRRTRKRALHPEIAKDS